MKSYFSIAVIVIAGSCMANGARVETDPWHQRPVASEIELQREENKTAKPEQQGVDVGSRNKEEGAASTQKSTLSNPWTETQTIPPQLNKVPCKDGNIHRLTDSCSSVVVCRKGKPQLVKCPIGEVYDRVSDSCMFFTIARC